MHLSSLPIVSLFSVTPSVTVELTPCPAYATTNFLAQADAENWNGEDDEEYEIEE